MNPSDEDGLLARCRKGEARAWDELFDRHYAATGRFVFQLGHDLTREDADEICQEVFLSVIKNIGLFRGGSQLPTWLFRIAANKARDFRQHRQAAKRGGGNVPISLNAEQPGTDLPIDPPGPGPAPDAILINTERMALVTESLDQLGDPCREIVELRYFGDLSYEEISKTLDLNLKTVSSRLSKCLNRLEQIVREIFGREKMPIFSV